MGEINGSALAVGDRFSEQHYKLFGHSSQNQTYWRIQMAIAGFSWAAPD